MSVFPVSFPSSRKGYNAYLKALGIDPKDQVSILFGAIPFEQFKTLDRRTIDEKIAEASAECERLHDVYQEAVEAGRNTDAAFAEAGWLRRSKEFIELVREKHS